VDEVRRAALRTGDVALAARLLRAGGLVALPTETVYGLGADAENPAAVARVYAAKGRPADHPLIVHLASTPRRSTTAGPSTSPRGRGCSRPPAGRVRSPSCCTAVLVRATT